MKEAFREQEPLWAMNDEWFHHALHMMVKGKPSLDTVACQYEWDQLNKTTAQAKQVCAWPGPRQRQK